MAEDGASTSEAAASFRLEVTSSAETTRLAAVGNFVGWHLSDSVQLTEAAGDLSGADGGDGEVSLAAPARVPARLPPLPPAHPTRPR